LNRRERRGEAHFNAYAMQQLWFKILNDIAWEKPHPPPNLSCRYFTHSTKPILWDQHRTKKLTKLFEF